MASQDTSTGDPVLQLRKYEYKGVSFQASTNPIENIKAMETFAMRDGDIVIVAYPKADWKGALRTVLRNILIHVGENPDTYYRVEPCHVSGDQQGPEPPRQPVPAPQQPVPAPRQPAAVPSPQQPVPAPQQPVPAPRQPVPAPRQSTTDPDRSDLETSPANPDQRDAPFTTTPNPSPTTPPQHSRQSTPNFSLLNSTGNSFLRSDSPSSISASPTDQTLPSQSSPVNSSPPYPPPAGAEPVLWNSSPIQKRPPPISPRKPSTRVKVPKMLFTPSSYQ